MELWAHQASLGLLVNLADRVPQAPQAPHLQVSAIMLCLTYSVALLASLLTEGIKRCQQRSTLCFELETTRGTLIYLGFLHNLAHSTFTQERRTSKEKKRKINIILVLFLAFWRTNREREKNYIYDVLFTLSEK